MEEKSASQIFAHHLDLVIPECKKCGNTTGWIYANREGPSKDLFDYTDREPDKPSKWTHKFIVSTDLAKSDENIKKALTAYYHLCSCSPTETPGTITGIWIQGAKLYPFSIPEFCFGPDSGLYLALTKYTNAEICESLRHQKLKCSYEECEKMVDIMECHDQYIEAVACLNGSACTIERLDDGSTSTWKRNILCTTHSKGKKNNFVIIESKLIPNTGQHNTEPTWFLKRPMLKELYRTEELRNLMEQSYYFCDVPGCKNQFVGLEFRDLHILAIHFPEDWGGRGFLINEKGETWERVDVCDKHPEVENIHSWAVIERKAMTSGDN